MATMNARELLEYLIAATEQFELNGVAVLCDGHHVRQVVIRGEQICVLSNEKVMIPLTAKAIITYLQRALKELPELETNSIVLNYKELINAKVVNNQLILQSKYDMIEDELLTDLVSEYISSRGESSQVHTSVLHSSHSIKTLGEALSYAETTILTFYADTTQGAHYASVIAELLRDVERQRPVGRDGKHGDRHTDSCGCEF